MISEYWCGAHTKHRVKVHLVWVPKYRKRVLMGEVADRLKILLEMGCEMNEWYIHELAVKADHVHLLIQINPRDSISKVVQILKGGTSKVIRQEYPELEEFLWGDSFWSDGYFAESVGIANEEVIQKYIQDQMHSMPLQS
jgi:putative transposase